MKNYSCSLNIPEILTPDEEHEAVDQPDAVQVRLATKQDSKYALLIAREMQTSAIARGTGIAYRSVESICEKMSSGHAVIAITAKGKWVGFSYVEPWEHGIFVSNSGMIVSAEYRKNGVAKAIKRQIMDLCRNLYPKAQIFSITSTSAIMKMNTRFGFGPVSFEEITKDRNFWNQCRHCVNYNILESKQFKNCFCSAMLYSKANKNE